MASYLALAPADACTGVVMGRTPHQWASRLLQPHIMGCL